MKIQSIFTDDEAVSPVIGVILMVAITVILAAVIGAFVLGIGGSQEQVPQASFSFSQSDTGIAVTATHSGGDKISSGSVTAAYTGNCGAGSDIDTSTGNPSDWTAGTSYEVAQGCDAGDTVSLVWSSSSSDSTNILTEYTV